MQEAQATNLITCANCGAKNRVPLTKRDQTAKCGRCHQPLEAAPEEKTGPGAPERLTLRCGQCRAKNRVPMSRLNADPKCGRCGEPLERSDVASGRSVTVSDANFERTVLKSPLPVLLYAWAPWCSVCSGINSMVYQLASETRGKIRVGMLNISDNPKLAGSFNILSVPSFLIFDAGQLKEQFAGAARKYDLMMKMAPLLY